MSFESGLEGAARGMQQARAARARFCRSCGHEGMPEMHTPGSILISLLLLACFFFPGVIYIIWRRSAAHEVCEKCGSRDIVPATSPMAAIMRKQLGSEPFRVTAPPSGGFFSVAYWKTVDV